MAGIRTKLTTDPGQRPISPLQIRDRKTQAGGGYRLLREAALDLIEKRSPLQSPTVKWPQSPQELIRADRER